MFAISNQISSKEEFGKHSKLQSSPKAQSGLMYITQNKNTASFAKSSQV